MKMNWLEFIASIVGSISWPTVFVAAFYFLRKPIRELLPLLQRLKYKEIELEFAKRVEEINAEVEQELPNVSGMPETQSVNDAIETEGKSPRSAVLEAWMLVEMKAANAARRLGWEPSSQKSTRGTYAMKFLENQPQLDRRLIGSLRDLRSLRNQAAHLADFALSPSSAADYVASATRLAKYLDSIATS
jgi:hypothetical protein